MFKKMSLLILAVVIVGFCVTTIPASRADAAAIKCSGKHNHKKESGVASCKGQNAGGSASKSFKTSSSGKYSALLKNLLTDYYTVRVKGKCGASASKSDVYASGYIITKVTINY